MTKLFIVALFFCVGLGYAISRNTAPAYSLSGGLLCLILFTWLLSNALMQTAPKEPRRRLARRKRPAPAANQAQQPKPRKRRRIVHHQKQLPTS